MSLNNIYEFVEILKTTGGKPRIIESCIVVDDIPREKYKGYKPPQVFCLEGKIVKNSNVLPKSIREELKMRNYKLA
ncbi:MAG: hypothetical protein QXX38_00065 [Candidatus Aenigmatarchaeota archaeon]